MAETDSTSSTNCSLLDLARYAVVCLVALGAIAVVVRTLPVVLHRTQVKFVVTDGFVQVDRFPVLPPPSNLTIWFSYIVYNPTAFDITYRNIMVRLVDVSSVPPADVFRFDVEYRIRLQSLESLWMYDKEIAVPSKDINDSYVSLFYDERNVEVAMQVEALLTLSPQSPEKSNMTEYVKYYCWPVTMGFDSASNDDVSCFQDTRP